ncbi:response regulator transcription factor [Propionivibrio soli]|jgi:DNA-binding NarL/FixJ family response regulator|uniref:response regulator transcription factor n=1 Tax=Propionivibrio soli TaxID=2976531 RepID=UPI0021E907D5|nr:response regulator transcription factor [Propionivibrio soli]
MVTRVVIADDHQLVRAGIAALLDDIPDVEVVGEAADGSEAVRLVEELLPSILFLDLAMPGMPGLEALALINESHPEVKVVILSMHDSEEHVLRALKLGATGFMLKDAAPEELAQAVKAINQGHTWLSSAVSKTVISSYVQRSGNEEGLNLLTARQNQVLKMIAEGRSTKDIGYELNLSVKTIETYRAQIMDKLDIRDIPGLVRYAIRNGIIPL